MNQISEHLHRITAFQEQALNKLGLLSRIVSSGYGKPPWIDPPDDAIPFDPAGVINTPLVGATANILVLQVPNGCDGVIKRFSCNINAPFVDGSGQLIWRITIDGRPVRNYDNMLVQMGTPASPRITDGIRVFSGQQVVMTVTNVAYAAGGTQTYGFFGGYFYPKPREGRAGRA